MFKGSSSSGQLLTESTPMLGMTHAADGNLVRLFPSRRKAVFENVAFTQGMAPLSELYDRSSRLMAMNEGTLPVNALKAKLTPGTGPRMVSGSVPLNLLADKMSTKLHVVQLNKKVGRSSALFAALNIDKLVWFTIPSGMGPVKKFEEISISSNS